MTLRQYIQVKFRMFVWPAVFESSINIIRKNGSPLTVYPLILKLTMERENLRKLYVYRGLEEYKLKIRFYIHDVADKMKKGLQAIADRRVDYYPNDGSDKRLYGNTTEIIDLTGENYVKIVKDSRIRRNKASGSKTHRKRSLRSSRIR